MTENYIKTNKVITKEIINNNNNTITIGENINNTTNINGLVNINNSYQFTKDSKNFYYTIVNKVKVNNEDVYFVFMNMYIDIRVTDPDNVNNYFINQLEYYIYATVKSDSINIEYANPMASFKCDTMDGAISITQIIYPNIYSSGSINTIAFPKLTFEGLYYMYITLGSNTTNIYSGCIIRRLYQIYYFNLFYNNNSIFHWTSDSIYHIFFKNITIILPYNP